VIVAVHRHVGFGVLFPVVRASESMLGTSLCIDSAIQDGFSGQSPATSSIGVAYQMDVRRRILIWLIDAHPQGATVTAVSPLTLFYSHACHATSQMQHTQSVTHVNLIHKSTILLVQTTPISHA